MIIGDSVTIGGGGQTASILATGALTSADSCYATKGGKTYQGVWYSEGISEYTYIKWNITKKRATGETYIQASEFRFIDQNNNIYTWDVESITADMSPMPSEVVGNLLDGDTSTKYCTSDWGTGVSNNLNIVIHLNNPLDLSIYNRYQYYTANDDYNRDPVTWTISVSNDGTNWITVSTINDATITTTRQALAGTWGITIPTTQGFLIDKLKEYGAYSVTGIHNSKTQTINVVVESAEQYNVQFTFSRLPSGYTEVRDIQSSGTQYINTNTYQLSKIEISNYKVTGTTNYHYYIGSWRSDQELVFRYQYIRYQTSSTSIASYNLPTPTLNYEYTDEYINFTTGQFKIYGTQGTFSPIALSTFVNSAFLFARNENGTPLYFGYYAMGETKLYDNSSTLIRDFVPCINPSNVVGMYDLVSQQFFGNSGSGVFTAGNPV